MNLKQMVTTLILPIPRSMSYLLITIGSDVVPLIGGDGSKSKRLIPVQVVKLLGTRKSITIDPLDVVHRSNDLDN